MALLLALAFPAPAAARAKHRPPHLTIAVRHHHLVNAGGRTVSLHGVNISGTQWQCLYGQAFDSPSDDASIDAMVAWHINVARIPLNEDCWLGINGAPSDIDRYHAEIRDYVNRLHAHGIYAILNLHWSAPGGLLSNIGAQPKFSGFFGMADADHAPAFWSSLAAYFKHDHGVLFDLYNEPNYIDWSCLRNGCTVPATLDNHLDFQSAGMQSMLDAVRATGATQPVMVAGLQMATILGRSWIAYRPHDPRHQLVASVHLYGPIAATESNLGIVARHFPVVAGEVGEKNCAHNVLDAVLPWLDSHGISYAAWAWFTDDCAIDPALISDYNGTPTPYGIGYRDHLLANFPAPRPPRRGSKHHHGKHHHRHHH